MNINELQIGEHFTYKNLEWIVLDKINNNIFAMTAKPWKELPFNNEYDNNWASSSLRKTLNTEFLSMLDKKHLVSVVSDLVADNGDDMYGTTSDYITILSCDQYRKYRKIVPLFEEWMWTLTPWSCTSITDRARYVNYSGGIISSGVTVTYGVAPACMFASENLKLHRQVQLVGAEEDA